MTALITLPLKVSCRKCGWEQLLDLENHGPAVFYVPGMGPLLKNKPKLCASCGSARLTEERGWRGSLPLRPGGLAN
jgi:hypothetical protein